MRTIQLEDGTEIEVGLDIDRIIDYENAHSEWNFFDFIEKLDQRMRLADIDLMVKFMGFSGLKQMMASGVSMEELQDLIAESEVMGFTASASDAPDASEI